MKDVWLSPELLLSLLFISTSTTTTWAATARYRTGRIQIKQDEKDGILFATKENINVAHARHFCQLHEECISFGFESATSRFPPFVMRAFFFKAADWSPSVEFLEDPAWHLYVNTTRELERIPQEMNSILERLENFQDCQHPATTTSRSDEDKEMNRDAVMDSGRKLRSSGGSSNSNAAVSNQLDYWHCIQQTSRFLDSMYHLIYPKQHKIVVLKTTDIIAKLLQWSKPPFHELIRRHALTNLNVLADASETAIPLIQGGIYETMVELIEETIDIEASAGDARTWEGIPILALDVISNISLYRSANHLLRAKGAPEFITHIMVHTTGFPQLQSTLALLHLNDSEALKLLPETTLKEIVELLQNSIDGDLVYNIKWDLIPGPLSALQLLVDQEQHNYDSEDEPSLVMEKLVDCGIVEQLLRVLDEECLQAPHVEAALEILQGLALRSPQAREMIFLAGHFLHTLLERLEEFQPSARLAHDLTSTLTKPNFVNPAVWEEEL